METCGFPMCWSRFMWVRSGRDALVASVYETQMLRMRRFGKDRCGYDARNTGLRHNRSLPRYRKRLEQSRSHLTTALIPRSTHVRHTVLCDHLQSTRTNHQPLSSDSNQASERSLQFDSQSNARPFMRRKATEGHIVSMLRKQFTDRHDKNLIHDATFTELHDNPTSPPSSGFSSPHL